MKLADNLKRIRKENNLSQEQLAEKIGVSRQAVSKWESGQSYPEMDKVLLICKLFNYGIDELMNENVKQVEENKQSKNNINKYIDDFFAFITKTVDMFSHMKFRQIVKCFIEQIVVLIIVVSILGIIGSIASSILYNLLEVLPEEAINFVSGILGAIYITVAFIAGVAVLLHIFKIRYLDYYEIIQKEDTNVEKNSDIDFKEEADKSASQKDMNKKDNERIVIRDPEHSQSKFLTGIIRIVVWFIKFFVLCIALGFVFSFVFLVSLLVLSFMFVKTGLTFFGALLAIIAAILVNFIVLEIIYDFIVNKKANKTRMAFLFILSLVLAGLGIGMVLTGMTKFKFVDELDENALEKVYNFDMTENLSIYNWPNDIEYIESDSNDIKIIVKYSKYSDIKMYNNQEIVELYCVQKHSLAMEALREIIKNLNNKEIRSYYNCKTYVYTSKENIEKLKYNKLVKEKERRKEQIDEYEEQIDELESRVEDLEDENLELLEKLDEKNFND